MLLLKLSTTNNFKSSITLFGGIALFVCISFFLTSVSFAQAALNSSLFERILDPSKPVTDLGPIVKKQCRKSMKWRMFDGQVLMQIRYPKAEKERALRLRGTLTQAYEHFEKITKSVPPVGLDGFLIVFSEIPDNFTFTPEKIKPRQMPDLLIFMDSKETDENTISTAVHTLIHESSHAFLISNFHFKPGPGGGASRWFDDGFGEYLSARVASDIGLLYPKRIPREEVIEMLSDTYIQQHLWTWKNISVKEIRKLEDPQSFWEKQDKLYRAGQAVLEAIETLGGGDIILETLKETHQQTVFEPGVTYKAPTIEDYYLIIESRIGFDIRNWDVFLKHYEEKTAPESAKDEKATD